MDLPDLVLDAAGAQLRVLRMADVHDGYVCGLNDPEVNRFLVDVKATPQNRNSVEQFVRTNAAAGDAVLFGIWETGRDSHSGTVRLHHIEHASKSAHIGICLFDRSAWGKRLGTRAIRAVTTWAQEALGLVWIEAGVYEGNDASQRAFVAAGYDWIRDIGDQYRFEGSPVVVHIYASRRTPRSKQTE